MIKWWQQLLRGASDVFEPLPQLERALRDFKQAIL
jgi:hypothetical protein